jgi:shikimate dehydrogenase
LRSPDGSRAEWPTLALLGDPVAHSSSPAIHERALRALGIPASYRAVQISAQELGVGIEASWHAGARGLQLTLPHKRAVLEYCAAQSAEVARLGAANTLRRTPGGWEAHNTDLPGLVRALRESFPEEPWKGECAVVGAGGAARACLAALEELGSGRCRVFARDPGRALWVEEFGALPLPLADAELEDLDLLLQATPLGLEPEDPSPIDPSRLRLGCAVMDLCYGDSPPRLLREHAPRGPVADGRAMLMAQAEIAFGIWFPGEDAHECFRLPPPG